MQTCACCQQNSSFNHDQHEEREGAPSPPGSDQVETPPQDTASSPGANLDIGFEQLTI